MSIINSLCLSGRPTNFTFLFVIMVFLLFPISRKTASFLLPFCPACPMYRMKTIIYEKKVFIEIIAFFTIVIGVTVQVRKTIIFKSTRNYVCVYVLSKKHHFDLIQNAGMDGEHLVHERTYFRCRSSNVDSVVFQFTSKSCEPPGMTFAPKTICYCYYLTLTIFFISPSASTYRGYKLNVVKNIFIFNLTVILGAPPSQKLRSIVFSITTKTQIMNRERIFNEINICIVLISKS